MQIIRLYALLGFTAYPAHTWQWELINVICETIFKPKNAAVNLLGVAITLIQLRFLFLKKNATCPRRLFVTNLHQFLWLN